MKRETALADEDIAASPARAHAILAGGCFWCLEAVFQNVRGVHEVVSGYIGGTPASANYEAVCRGDSGHAEAVRIAYDPAQLGFHDLLGVFFMTHDPTQLNRQGNDIGSQYRSAVFYLDESQRVEAERFIATLRADEVFGAPIVTELVAAGVFHPAEAYHQNYYRTHPQQGYCSFVIAPKLAKFREHFAHLIDDAA